MRLHSSLVRAGGLGFYSRDFQSLGLKLIPMDVLHATEKRHLISGYI